MTTITLPRAIVEQALEALEFDGFTPDDLTHRDYTTKAITALRAALAEPVQTQQENTMPITDDNGQALRPQYRVIERHGNWQLLYDPLQIGETMIHEFRIQKFRHDIALYPGISLAEAQKRFRERVEADNE